MSRIFRRGELRSALLHVLARTGPANGYTMMQQLATHVGGGWRPSPGAIYPALLALEDAGHVTGRSEDGTRLYTLTPEGRRACDDRSDLLDELAGRAASAQQHITLGALVDEFASNALHRSARLDPTQVRATTTALNEAERRITDVLNQGSKQ